MRLSRIAPALVLIVACGGDKDTDSGGPAAPSCDTIQTTPISQLSPEEYPEGLGAGIEALQNLEGLWTAPHCITEGRTIAVKITGMPGIPDDIAVVDQKVDAAADCGCSADLQFESDNRIDQVATVPPFEFFLDINEDLDDTSIDPALDDQSFTIEGSLYGGADGLLYRGCQTKLVEPYLNSEYDTVAVNLRLETNPSGTALSHLGLVTLEAQLIKQEQGAEPVVCTVTDFTKVNN